MDDFEKEIQMAVLEEQREMSEVRQIMLDKLKEMLEIEFKDCANGEYPEICSVMNDIAKTLLGK